MNLVDSWAISVGQESDYQLERPSWRGLDSNPDSSVLNLIIYLQERRYNDTYLTEFYISMLYWSFEAEKEGWWDSSFQTFPSGT